MSLRVAMRADASAVIGTGHVARCLTLADQVRARGGHVRVLARAIPPHLRAWIESHGHECEDLGAAAEPVNTDLAHGAWLGTSQAADARAVIRALSGHTWDWLVVDHYAIDACWESAVRASAPRLLAIDDLADRRHDVDVLLDQNLPADPMRYAALVPPTCRLLLGPAFALVREEFNQVPVRARDGRICRVLVFLGGSDAGNLTAVAIDACLAASIEQADVVIGAAHGARAAIEDACRHAGYQCHVQTSRFAELMASADLAIGAAGSASWERCAVGLPTLGIATALNQVSILHGLAARGAVFTLAQGRPVTVDTLAEALRDVRRDPARVRAVAETARMLVDGQGVSRVCDVMEAA